MFAELMIIHLSNMYCHQAFRMLVGMTPTEYIRKSLEATLTLFQPIQIEYRLQGGQVTNMQSVAPSPRNAISFLKSRFRFKKNKCLTTVKSKNERK